MKRREFISFLAGAAAAWPLAVRAQQPAKVLRVGFLGTSSLSLERHLVEAFLQKLRELGYIEGKTIAIEYRWAEGQDDRLPGLAADLARVKPDVIVTSGTPGTLAAKRATATIPIVFASSSPASSGPAATSPDSPSRDRSWKANVCKFLRMPFQRCRASRCCGTRPIPVTMTSIS